MIANLRFMYHWETRCVDKKCCHRQIRVHMFTLYFFWQGFSILPAHPSFRSVAQFSLQLHMPHISFSFIVFPFSMLSWRCLPFSCLGLTSLLSSCLAVSCLLLCLVFSCCVLCSLTPPLTLPKHALPHPPNTHQHWLLYSTLSLPNLDDNRRC